MIYDYGIVGAGIAGCVCAYELSKRGNKCIIFEKNNESIEKVCGGGVSYKALRMLFDIGIEIEPLFLEQDTKMITGHRIYMDGECYAKQYKQGNISLGTQRIILDKYLMDCAVNKGAIVKYGVKVDNLNCQSNFYDIDGIYVKKIIWAIGAKTSSGKVVKGQSIGYSGQILTESSLEENLFHYWYYEYGNKMKYFWAFPIGENLWNVGVWSRFPNKTLKDDYIYCLKKYFMKTIIDDWEYYREPKAEFLGHIDQRTRMEKYMNGIGDFAGMCNPANGGGIIGAIESAIQFSNGVFY